ncbi:guanine nucleotide exchange protein for ADP-robosylation factor [Malassezia japonica]|uniref:Guanine nucleotide exchange protein for ADP-robosylation factor n=1 Tax=Malassezia japonica TaxID=223818 RepID=A0AAF0EZM6_9BASI|nr:guanine nucleotide exchange protein for ADP-robosylation factor [Malassezia japonica]WFD39955.1 guanine nucleotide exchange protein for ADP-robosylation factor [Malassezia japonica]
MAAEDEQHASNAHPGSEPVDAHAASSDRGASTENNTRREALPGAELIDFGDQSAAPAAHGEPSHSLLQELTEPTEAPKEAPYPMVSADEEERDAEKLAAEMAHASADDTHAHADTAKEAPLQSDAAPKSEPSAPEEQGAPHEHDAAQQTPKAAAPGDAPTAAAAEAQVEAEATSVAQATELGLTAEPDASRQEQARDVRELEAQPAQELGGTLPVHESHTPMLDVHPEATEHPAPSSLYPSVTPEQEEEDAEKLANEEHDTAKDVPEGDDAPTSEYPAAVHQDAPAEDSKTVEPSATEPADAPVDSNDPAEPAAPTDEPAERSDAPTEPTDAPTERADAPTEPTDEPAERTDAPAEPTDAPAERADAPLHEQSTAPVDVPNGAEPVSGNRMRPSVHTASVLPVPDSDPSPARSPIHSASSASSLSRGSAVFVVSALETIANSKEAKRSKDLKESATTALDMVRRAAAPEASEPSILDPRVVFEPLRLACKTHTIALQTTSLDCIAKLVSYAFFAEDEGSTTEEPPLADLVVDTVCDCFEDQLDERVSVQIVKALLACVLSTSIRVHQSSLLRAVRTVYNVFLVSRTPATQAIAQGSLSQMISYVFSRVPRKGKAAAPEEEKESGERVTLQEMESRNSFEGTERDDVVIAPAAMDAPDLLVKDAFLVLRALCKLSMKTLGTESERDMRSQSMRSKLLSLHMIHNILQMHMDVFTDASVQILSSSSGEQSSFVQAAKQYLCLSLSRNAVSSVIQVFEISCEIFWLLLHGMRTKVKKEIEVLFNEIFLPILEMRSSTAAQKSVLLGVVNRLCRDPQALVEIYLNYDCDRSALENVYERLMNVISRLAQTPSTAVSGNTADPVAEARSATPLHRMPSTGAVPKDEAIDAETSGIPLELRLKRQSLECLCSVLHSLVEWSGRSFEEEGTQSDDIKVEHDEEVEALAAQDDDPGRFENAKQRKTTLLEAIRTFNYKPKRGIDRLIEHGFIRSRDPQAIARFLFYADGLSKANIGEYLGEGEPENIAIMHAFVDLMNFDQLPFTTALRRFLQAFRLPGEAQKIDRYMLKFAERYIAGNKGAFANADTAYILAYSVIMLNTDAHNPQVKHRMTLADFIKNNAGIDDGANLPEDFLRSIYEEIQKHEIKMKDEAPPAPNVPQGTGFATAIATVGRDLQHEQYVLQSEGMANRTEVLFRTMLTAQRRAGSQQRAMADQFFSASHMEHVKPMFEVAWMSFLAGISTPLQDSTDPDTIRQVLGGFRDAIKIVCFFGLELERNAFVTTLAKFTFLNNFGEMRGKNVETIKALLGIAHTEGNYLRGSWREVLTCVSQLERFQLISGGVDQRMLPELGRRHSGAGNAPRGSVHLPTNEVVQAGASSEITVAADRVFSSTPNLSGEAIVDFVQSLCDLSWEEIQSSGMSDNPRLFSLQKLVEISYYNMSRIRMEWSRLWQILGEHFNQVCCHPNPAVSAFGLDSLRQLAMKFLEKDELHHFKFQKDFLKPFEYAMRRNPDLGAKEMVLQCLEQMIQSRSDHIRSGWATMFGVFGVAAGAPERVAVYAFELVKRVHSERFEAILANSSFGDVCVCMAHFGKVGSQKISLPATDLLRTMVPAMLERSASVQDADASTASAAAVPPSDLWLPVLFALYDILMTGDDLEVRRVALDALFGLLKEHGAEFTPTFWDTVCQDVLFPIFNVLRNRSDVTRFSSQEDMSVWLSTTMIQALRHLVELWTYYFDTLQRRLAGLLELLCACICQENDTLARIGTTCLRELIVQNVDRLDDGLWQLVTDAFLRLFRATTAAQVFDPMLSSPDPAMGGTERRHAFKQIIVKCVLQLLLIETTNALLQETTVYAAIPAEQLLRLTQALEDSYRFSRRFNADRALRTALWKVGFMKQLPNLLKQESTSASTLVHVYLQMQSDAGRHDAHQQVSERFLPLAEEIISVYLPLDNETQARNIAAWTPVVAQVVDGLAALYDMPNAEATQEQCTRTFYLLAVELLDKVGLAPALAVPLRRYLTAVGLAHRLVDLSAATERQRKRDEAHAQLLRATPSTASLKGELYQEAGNASVDILPRALRSEVEETGSPAARLP